MIPPGGEGEIKVTLRPKGGNPDITKNVVVYSNDPEQPRFTLTMKGTLLVDMVAVPPSVQLMNLAPGKPGTATVSLERSRGSAASVQSVRVEDTKRFSIREIEPQLGAFASYEVRFAGGEVGSAVTKVIVETTGEHTPRLTIPVRASVVYNLSYPKRLTLVRRGEGPFEQTLRISTRRGDPPKIAKVEDPDGLLDIEVLEPDGPRVEIRLRARESEAAKIDERAAHELVVFTNDPEEPRLAIEYNFRIPGAQSRRGRAGAERLAGTPTLP